MLPLSSRVNPFRVVGHIMAVDVEKPADGATRVFFFFGVSTTRARPSADLRHRPPW